MAQAIWYAWVETARSTFSAVGLSESQARDGVMAAWRAHRAQYARSDVDEWLSDDVIRDDTQARLMVPGQGYRDYEPVGRPVKVQAGA